MIGLKQTQEHSIDSAFILILLALFAAVSILLISIGARQYQSIADHMSENFETRTISAYLDEKINQYDYSGSAEIVNLTSAVSALSLYQQVNEQGYLTYLYAYQGYLWEITVSADTVVVPGNGQQIIECKALSMEELSGNLYCFTVTETSGDSYPLYISMNSK